MVALVAVVLVQTQADLEIPRQQVRLKETTAAKEAPMVRLTQAAVAEVLLVLASLTILELKAVTAVTVLYLVFPVVLLLTLAEAVAELMAHLLLALAGLEAAVTVVITLQAQ
jgi:hypothetical protein